MAATALRRSKSLIYLNIFGVSRSTRDWKRCFSPEMSAACKWLIYRNYRNPRVENRGETLDSRLVEATWRPRGFVVASQSVRAALSRARGRPSTEDACTSRDEESLHELRQ